MVAWTICAEGAVGVAMLAFRFFLGISGLDPVQGLTFHWLSMTVPPTVGIIFHGKGWTNVTPVIYFADREGWIVTSLPGAQALESLRKAPPGDRPEPETVAVTAPR